MKKRIEENIQIPEEISCTYENGILFCKKGEKELKREIKIPGIFLSIQNNQIVLSADRGNRNQRKIINSIIKHILNMFEGLSKEYVYYLEACNVHFPMSLKVEGDMLLISNFLGEKTPRKAKILPGVKVEIKGTTIILSSPDKEAAGQTATNIEKSTKIKGRDRRIFQDGIYITKKPGEEL